MCRSEVTRPAALFLAAGVVSLGVCWVLLGFGAAAEPANSPSKGSPVETVRQLQVRLDSEIQKLIHQLASRSFKVRQMAIRQLTAIGRPALPGLRKALKDPDIEVRQRARQVINAIRTTLVYLLENLDHEDAQVRKAAAEALERQGAAARGAVPALVKALKDEDENVRDAAASALLSIDPKNKLVAGRVLAKARVGGKYAKLLKRIKVPQDKASYQDFTDFGYYEGTEWAGYTGLPAGYWVYVYPYWYIWGEMKNG